MGNEGKTGIPEKKVRYPNETVPESSQNISFEEKI
jgi:hypothetical protein